MVDADLWLLRLKKLWWLLQQPDRYSLLRHQAVPSLEHRDMLRGRRYSTVVDVGGNVGQFSLLALEEFDPRHLICVEPQLGLLDHLARRCDAIDCELTIVRAALSDRSGSRTLRRTKAADSSSLLRPTETAIRRNGGLRVEQLFDVLAVRADDVLSADLPRPILFKIDVQGTELEVLRGASTFLQHVDCVLVEAALSPIYEGQSNAAEVIDYLVQQRFALASASRVPAANNGWKLDQLDLLFERCG